MENPDPPGSLTRRARKALEEAAREKEQRILDEFLQVHVMMVGPDWDLTQPVADKVHDEGRLQLDAILRGRVE